MPSSLPRRPRPKPLARKQEKIPQPPSQKAYARPSTLHPSVIPCSDSDGSELTPLSSPVEDNAARKLEEKNPSTTRLDFTQSPVTSRRRVAPSTSLIDLEPWSVENLGTHVWVLLDARGRVLEPEDNDGPEKSARDWLWWPGKIISKSPKDIPLKIHLFGTIGANIRTADMRCPQQCNILSLKDSNQRDRFTIPTFAAHEQDLPASPRKKPKRDRTAIEEQWRSAVTELIRDREEECESDILPEVGTLEFTSVISFPTPSKSITKDSSRGRKRKRSDVSDEEAPQQARWSPAPPDDTLDIPGEHILAIERAGDSIFWPARILAYIPPKPPKKEGKYQVEFLDTLKKDIPRAWFYASSDTEFATCKLGEWESEYREVVNDEDDENSISPLLRSASPLPVLPLTKEFWELDIRQKFVFTKPVLSAILQARFSPARQRHDLFIRGGEGRNRVKKDAGLRGRMNPEDVSMLGEYLCEWCLRGERRVKDQIRVVESEGKEGQETRDAPAFELSPPVLLDTVMENEVPDDRSVSPTPTEPFHSSQAQMPPSSCCLSEDGSASQTSTSASSPAQNSSQPLDLNYTLPARQEGCEEYEALSGEEKVSYCLNVLLPEAILQILLWCNGHRTSIDTLTDEEEKRLHNLGEELLKETDWVNDVKRLRERARMLLKLGPDGKDDEQGGEWTSRGRPKRSVVKTVSYRE